MEVTHVGNHIKLGNDWFFPKRSIRTRSCGIRVVRNSMVKRAIQEIAPVVSEVVTRGSRLLCMYWLGRRESRSFPEDVKKDVAAAFRAVWDKTPKKPLDEGLLRARNFMKEFHGLVPYRKGTTEILQYSINQYCSTLLQTFDNTALPVHISMGWEASQYRHWLSMATSAAESDEYFSIGKFRIEWRSALHELAVICCDANHELYGESSETLANHLDMPAIDAAVVEMLRKEWKDRIDLAVLSHFNSFLLRVDLLDLIEKSQLDNQHFKTFPLLPEYSFMRHCIEIDLRAIKQLVGRKSAPTSMESIMDGHFMTRLKKEQTRKRSSYQRIQQRPLFGNEMQGPFIRTFSTDGIQMHFHLESIIYRKIKDEKIIEDLNSKMTSVDAPPCKRSRVALPKIEKMWNPDIPRKTKFLELRKGLFSISAITSLTREQKSDVLKHPITGVDPGFVNIIGGVVDVNADGNPLTRKERSIRISRKQYYWMIGTTGMRERPPASYYFKCKSVKQQRQRGWIHPKVKEAEKHCAQHSLHVSSFDKYSTALKECMPHWKSLFRWYCYSKTSARLRFWRARKQARTMDTIVHMVAPNEDQIISFGSAYVGQKQSKKGTSYGPAPVKKVKRYLALHRKVVLCNEYLTSQRCSMLQTERELRCGGTLERVVRMKTVKQYPPDPPPFHHHRRLKKERHDTPCIRKMMPVRGLCYCSQCRRYLSRDINSGRNMKHVLISMVNTGERPVDLQRPPPRESVAPSTPRVRRIIPKH